MTAARDALLFAGVAFTLVCCLGLLVLDDFYQRLHLLAPVSSVGAGLIVAAIILRERWGQATMKALFCLLVLLLMNAVLSHVTARAGRVQEDKLYEPD